MNECMNEWMNGWTDEWMNKWMNGLMNENRNELMNELMEAKTTYDRWNNISHCTQTEKYFTHVTHMLLYVTHWDKQSLRDIDSLCVKWINEWINEWMNEWMSERQTHGQIDSPTDR